MKTIKIFHFTALTLLGTYGALAARSLQGEALLYWLFALIYAALWCGLMGGSIWCARLLVVPPLLVVLRTAPMVIYNFYAFLARHPLYLDSPGTIIIVAIIALLVTAPSALVLAVYWKQRQRIFGMGKGGEPKASTTS